MANKTRISSSQASVEEENVYMDMTGDGPGIKQQVPPPLPPRIPTGGTDCPVVSNPAYGSKNFTTPNQEEEMYEEVRDESAVTPQVPSQSSKRSSSPPPYEYVTLTGHKSSIIKVTSDPVASKTLPKQKSGPPDGGSSDPVASKTLPRQNSGPPYGGSSDPVAIPSPKSGPHDGKEQPDKISQDIATPIGYNILSLLWKGNVVFIVPAGNEKKQPLSLSGKHVHGGGSYNDDSRFEVVVPREHSTETVVALRNVKHKVRYLCIDSRGKIKARDGYKDNCDFFVYVMGGAFSSIVYFESAQRDGYYLGMKSNGTVADASSIVPEAKEAQFTIIADVLQESVPTPNLKVFETDSILNQLHKRSVVRLFSHRRYLAIDKKGRVSQTHNNENEECWFFIIDRGMGVVSLLSYKYDGYWLKFQDGRLLGKAVLGLEAFFVVKESSKHLLCFESLLHPGSFAAPPLRTPAMLSPHEFTMEIVQ